MKKERSAKQPYIFGWSKTLKDFDSKLLVPTGDLFSKFELRQRFNMQRSIDIYGLVLTEEEADVLNEEWDSDMPNEQLKEQLDELGAVVIKKG